MRSRLQPTLCAESDCVFGGCDVVASAYPDQCLVIAGLDPIFNLYDRLVETVSVPVFQDAAFFQFAQKVQFFFIYAVGSCAYDNADDLRVRQGFEIQFLQSWKGCVSV